MNFKVFSILAMVALVFVFTTTADPAAPEEHVSETLAQKSEHASEDHHAAAAAGKAAAAHSHHVKRVKNAKKHEPIRRSREAKAAPQQHQKGDIAPKQATPTKTGVPIKAGATAPIHVPQGDPAVGAVAPLRKQPRKLWNVPKKPVVG